MNWFETHEALAILPGFIPVNQIKKAAAQILPELEITIDASFEKSDADVLIVTTFTKVDAGLLNRMPNLKFIQVASTGYDNVDLDEVKRRGIMLSNIPVANKEAVAEHVIMFALVLLRNFVQLNSQIRAGQWPVLTGGRENSGGEGFRDNRYGSHWNEAGGEADTIRGRNPL